MTTEFDQPRRFAGTSPRRPAAESRPPSLRQTQKEATRNRVLEAARELFDSQGYQGATIREIARYAGVAVGSVFTNFASKGEILSQVMAARLDGLYAELDRVVPHIRGTTADRLRSIFGVFFAFEAPRSKLFLSHIAAAYDWTLPPTARPFGTNQRLTDLLRECLIRGVAEGEVDPAREIQEIIDVLLAAYGWTYRLVITEGADAKRMTEAMDRRIGLIVEGLRPR
ncbi:MAG TPA: TetR/AcrR family transcriptional regulator [Phenylobacterium sp.]|uniref:TetR/AcrR family transcriptional regulator n=1 Tax=Phenylobacterium sp. TaxID=1871053 RepID=UPI002C92921C|nr:TetR/AcrR family transcriptional regulator [Phenylobacterium sp.]HSV03675.1 TetR/AcrR family transcriptional regulator [Phenylobacterium sp.]